MFDTQPFCSFENIESAQDVSVNVSTRIFNAIPYSCLGSKVNYNTWLKTINGVVERSFASSMDKVQLNFHFDAEWYVISS